MKETKVSLRYAKSLLGLAQEKNKLEEVNADMKLIAATCKGNHDLMMLLNSPIIKTDKKVAVLNAIFAGQLSDVSQSFVVLMTNKKREYLLGEVAEDFNSLYRTVKGIVKAEVTSAVALDDNIKSQIRARIGSDKQIEFVEKIDASLIGGFIVKVGDKQFDGSIARSITELKKTFSKNEYIPAF